MRLLKLSKNQNTKETLKKEIIKIFVKALKIKSKIMNLNKFLIQKKFKLARLIEKMKI